ncbi:MAG: glycoside hydrolase family 99-like domain-containing protein [Elusimicrobiota bacterium]|jgi:lipopolysaccharide biosynthesis protein|nr:glycoside hydrolase family 99-like domain-containing protein [Elusimicrobiota bacterium]
MKKALINLFCAFILNKQKRKEIRNKLTVKFIKDRENSKYYAQFVKFLENKDNRDSFVSITKLEPKKFDTKIIAFYLPQFYPIALNNAHHGQGFTEWFNVTKAFPNFTGHHQPHLPIDVGFYDLTHTDVMFRQIELAKLYGVYGFCAHYYWFSGEKLLNKPFENYLADKRLDLPFCFCWALENWTRKWDTGTQELIIEQKFQDSDAQKFFDDIKPFWQDERYIRIDSKPILIIYKPHLFEKQKVVAFLDKLRKLSKQNGIGDLYIIYARTADLFEKGIAENDSAQWGFDAYCDFPPHNLRNNIDKSLNVPVKKLQGYINPKFEGTVYDMQKYIDDEIYKRQKNDGYTLFKTCFPLWDNTPRFQRNPSIMDGMTPELYKKWLLYSIDWTKRNHDKNSQIVFINAWNEWAEGAHLEPCRRYGYAFLEATRSALEMSQMQDKK